jgi:transcriptional regulator with XRE-family HTH domain
MRESHGRACARSIRKQRLAEGWNEERIAQAIHEHCGITLLRGHRLARGWTLQDVAAELRTVCAQASGTEPAVSHQRISRWENGADKPSPRYLDALCRLYRSRPDRLGFGIDYGKPPPAAQEDTPPGASPSGPGTVVLRPAFFIDEPPPSPLSPHSPDIKDLPLELLGTLRDVRARADALLETQSVSAASVDWWEMLAEEYAEWQVHTPLDGFLSCIVQDFTRLQRVLSKRQPLEFQTRLYRAMAQLAGMIAFNLMGWGSLQESRGWFHTARLAADEAGDRQLRAWLTAYEAETYFWDAGLTGRAIPISEAAQRKAGSSPTAAGVYAVSIQARTYARLGRRREALEAMHRAETAFGRLDATETRLKRFAFPEQRLWCHRQNILTRLGEIETATRAREHALGLTREDMTVEPIQMKLDEAICLISANEIDEGCVLACRTLTAAANGVGGGVMWLRACEIDYMCRSRGFRLESARSLHQMVTQAAGQGLAPHGPQPRVSLR